jgi:hypothetical protein
MYQTITDVQFCRNYYSGDQIKRMRQTEHIERMGERRGAYRVLVGRPGGKRTFGTSRPK